MLVKPNKAGGPGTFDRVLPDQLAVGNGKHASKYANGLGIVKRLGG